MTREQAGAILQTHGIVDKVVWLGLRSPASKYGEYDDIAGLYTPDGYQEFKFNTLPSAWRQDMACLVPGVYRWRKGLHGMHHLNLGKDKDGAVASPKDQAAYAWLLAHPGQDHPDPAFRLTYWAFREIPPMRVIRCGHSGTFTDSDAAPFFIDGHHGGLNGTSSEACQTWPIEIWHAVRAAGFGAMDKYGQDEIAYCLVQLQ